MGDRVAVMRKGELQQVASPQELYDHPVNLFVGGFIGSPAMNMLEATIERFERRRSVRTSAASGCRSGDEALSDHPGLAALRGPEGHRRHPAGGPRGRRAGARRDPATAACAARSCSARRSARRSWSTSRSMPGRRRPRTSASWPRTSACRATGRRRGRSDVDDRRAVHAAVARRSRGRGRRPRSTRATCTSSIRTQAWASTTTRRKEQASMTGQGSESGRARRGRRACRARRLRQRQQRELERRGEQHDRVERERQGQHLDRRHLGRAGAEELPGA